MLDISFHLASLFYPTPLFFVHFEFTFLLPTLFIPFLFVLHTIFLHTIPSSSTQILAPGAVLPFFLLNVKLPSLSSPLGGGLAVVDAGAPFRPHLLHTATASSFCVQTKQLRRCQPGRGKDISRPRTKSVPRTKSGPTVDLIGVGIGLAAGKKTLSCFVLDARGA